MEMTAAQPSSAPSGGVETPPPPERAAIEHFYQTIRSSAVDDATLVQQLAGLRYQADGSDYLDTTTLQQLLADSYPADCPVPLERLDRLCRLVAMADYSDEELTLLDQPTRNQFMAMVSVVAALAAARQRRLLRRASH